MSPESSTCPYVVLKNKGLDLGGVCPQYTDDAPTRGVRPSGQGRAQTPVSSHRWWGTPGPSPVPVAVPSRARPGDPPRASPAAGLGIRELGPAVQVGVCDVVGHARAKRGVCPWHRSGVPGRPGCAVGSCARARPGRGVLLSRVVARAPTGGAAWSPGARAAGRQKNKRGTEAPLRSLLLLSTGVEHEFLFAV
jgi:hypothetical protein